MSPPRLRAIVYIDGFNLYYGSIKDGPHKWLDLERFCVRLRTDDDIVRIHYFTSRVDGIRGDRQRVFLEALQTRLTITITLGRFKRKTVPCLNTRCTLEGDRTFQVPEEKRTDVAIGVQMIDDAYQDLCDRFILISGDSDLVPAVERIRQRCPSKRITVYRPVGPTHVKARRGDELGLASGDGRLLPLDLLRHCHLPDPVVRPDGTLLHKPNEW